MTLIDRDDLSHTDATRFCYIFGLLAGFCDREIASRPIEFCFVIDIVSSTLYTYASHGAHTREDSIHGVEFSDFDRETMRRNESIDRRLPIIIVIVRIDTDLYALYILVSDSICLHEFFQTCDLGTHLSKSFLRRFGFFFGNDSEEECIWCRKYFAISTDRDTILITARDGCCVIDIATDDPSRYDDGDTDDEC